MTIPWRAILPIALSLASNAALATPVLGDVVVSAPRLSGYWSVIGPNLIEFKIGALSGIRIIYSGQTDTRDICLIKYLAARISATCSAGFSSNGDGAVENDRVSLRWWDGPANLIFSGGWDRNATIDGAFSGGLAGIAVTGHIPATLKKISPAATLPGSAGAMRAVLDDLRRGVLTTASYEPGALKRMRRAQNWAGASLPAPHLAYLGGIYVHWQRGQPNLAEDVYEVSSGAHLSLCRIGISDRGLVDDFACQESAS